MFKPLTLHTVWFFRGYLFSWIKLKNDGMQLSTSIILMYLLYNYLYLSAPYI